MVLFFGCPSTFFAAASFFTAVPFLGAGLVFLSSLAMVFSRVDLSDEINCFRLAQFVLDNACDAVRATGPRSGAAT